MSDKKFEYDPLQHIVEKERTRTLIIEAVKQDHISVYWRHVVVMSILSLGIAGYWWTHKTLRGRDFLEAVQNADPLKGKKHRKGAGMMLPKISDDPDKFVEDAHAAWAKKEAMEAAAGTNQNANPDDMQEEIAAQQKSREALGAQLEAVGQGKMLPPSPEAVKAAMEGKAMPPAAGQAMFVGAPQGGDNAAAPRAPSSAGSRSEQATGIDGGDKKEEELPTSLEAVTSGAAQQAPSYRQVSQIPPAYAADKTEFPDIH